MTEGFSSDELLELKRALLSLEEHLLSSIEIGKDSSKPVQVDAPIGRLTRMDAIQQQQMAKASHANNELRLKQVRAALRAMEMDEFGECQRCGEYISLKRLRARPEAPFCLNCQSASERT